MNGAAAGAVAVVPVAGLAGAGAASVSSNATSTLLTVAPPPAAPVDAGIAPEGCEVGKFCKPVAPDPDNCGTLTLGQEIEVKHLPGNLLLVFDQSASMSEPWGAIGQTKLAAAQSAIQSAITSLADSLTVGALFFPTASCLGGGLPGGQGAGPALPLPGPGAQPGGLGGIVGGLVGGRAVEPIDGMGQIPFQPASQFLNAWNQHWAGVGAALGVGTPMQEAFDRANDAIASAKLEGDLAVVAVTDGQPNCMPSGGQTDLEMNRARDWLAMRGVKTYVVGLPGAAGVQLLNDVAVQGGTMQYILPDDPKMLEDRLRTLVKETMKTVFDSSSIHLKPAADPPSGLQMVVVEAKDGSKHQVPHELAPGAGWTISPDGAQVEIAGSLCDDAKGGRFTSITFQYPCKSGEPLTPLTPAPQ
jgi:hypothetical protein